MKTRTAFKIALIAAVIAVSLPASLLRPGIDRDLSCKTALVYCAHHNIRFGSNLVWIAGPAAVLAFPQAPVAVFPAAVVFQSALWLAFAGLLVFVTVRRQLSVAQLAIFACCFLLGGAFDHSVEHLIVFLVLFLLSLALTVKDWMPPFVGALVLTAFLCFDSAAAAVMATGSVLVFVIAAWHAERLIGIRAAVAAAVSAVVLIAMPYSIYAGSFAGAAGYLRGVYELVSNYSVAMSLMCAPSIAASVPSLSVIYLALMLLAYRARQASFYISLMAFAPLVVALKIASVRCDPSTASAFYGLVLYVFALGAIFTEGKKTFLAQNARGLAAAMLVLALLVCPFMSKSVVSVWRGVRHGALCAQSISTRPAVSSPALPPVVLQAIGKGTVSVFPDEAAIVIAGGLRYLPLPVFRTYAAYTPYLDELVARFLSKGSTAPRSIVFRWRSIDGRHPLMDVPATWLALYRWYRDDLPLDNGILLQRRDAARFASVVFLESKECSLGERVRIPLSAEPVIACIRMELNIRGRLLKLFYKVPEVRMALYEGSSLKADYRVIPDTLVNGLLINFLPIDIETLRTALKGDKMPYLFSSFKIYGPGASCYNGTILVRYFTTSSSAGPKK